MSSSGRAGGTGSAHSSSVILPLHGVRVPERSPLRHPERAPRAVYAVPNAPVLIQSALISDHQSTATRRSTYSYGSQP